MDKYVLIIPYYGQWPSYFDEWAVSASYNGYIDFKILTDLPVPNWCFSHPNIEFIHKSLAEIKKRADDVLGFRTFLTKPYKLCDFKPFYGLLFPELTHGYDWWGYGDIDVIYGNLISFWPDTSSPEVKFLYGLGHLSFFRNEKWLTMLPLSIGRRKLKRVFTTSVTIGLDESDDGLPTLLSKMGYRGAGDLADIHDMIVGVPFLKPAIHFNGYYHHLYSWNAGHLYCVSTDDSASSLHNEDCFYMHLQKRPMVVNVKSPLPDGFAIFPSEIRDATTITPNEILQNSIRPSIGKRRNWLKRAKTYLVPRIGRRMHLIFDRFFVPF